MDGPCESGWTPTVSLCSDWGSHSAAVQAYALRTAIWVVWAAAGRRHGPCPRTVRPCSPAQAPLYQTYPVSFNGHGEGYWTLSGVPSGGVQLLGPCCMGACSCTPSQVALPGNVDSVTEVRIDGAVLDPAAYQLQGAGLLVRIDGQPWPSTQDLSIAAGQPDTWSITYLDGIAVPGVLNDAAGIYACQVARARTGGTCRLPNRVQSVTRQGVEIQYVDSENYLDENRTGVAEVDQLIATVNPNRLQRAPQFWSPDMPSFR